MANKTLSVKVLNVCKTTAQWATETTVISKGLLCVELTTDGKTLVKIGDGVKTYTQLPYITDGSFSISDYSTTTEVNEIIDSKLEALGNIIRIKGVKGTVAELPTEGNEIGDLWFVGAVTETSDSFAEYIYTSENKFEFLGRVQTDVDLSEYATTTYVDGLVEQITTRLEALETASHTHANKEALDKVTPELMEKLKDYEPYVLPAATAEALGGIKLGGDLQIDENGVVTTNIPDATDTTPGLMAPADKTKLNELAETDLSAFVKDTDDLTLDCHL